MELPKSVTVLKAYVLCNNYVHVMVILVFYLTLRLMGRSDEVTLSSRFRWCLCFLVPIASGLTLFSNVLKIPLLYFLMLPACVY